MAAGPEEWVSGVWKSGEETYLVRIYGGRGSVIIVVLPLTQFVSSALHLPGQYPDSEDRVIVEPFLLWGREGTLLFS